MGQGAVSLPCLNKRGWRRYAPIKQNFKKNPKKTKKNLKEKK